MDWLFPKKSETHNFGTTNPALGVKSLADRYNGIVQTLTKEVKGKYPEIYNGIKKNNPGLPSMHAKMACESMKNTVQSVVGSAY
jgi:hypothetical protein